MDEELVDDMAVGRALDALLGRETMQALARAELQAYLDAHPVPKSEASMPLLPKRPELTPDPAQEPEEDEAVSWPPPLRLVQDRDRTMAEIAAESKARPDYEPPPHRDDGWGGRKF